MKQTWKTVLTVAAIAIILAYGVVTVLPVLVLCGMIVIAAACSGGASAIPIIGIGSFVFFFVVGLVISPFVRAGFEKRKGK